MRQFDLKTISSDCAAKIKTAKLGVNYFIEPFKHLVIDNFFEKTLAELCLDNFPELDESYWESENDKDIEVKFRSKWTSEFDIPEGVVDVVKF